jgi:arylsulfatase A-like enzyme
MLATLKSPFVLWLHAKGFGGAWDAPYEFRQQFADEDDPEPPDIVEPPELVLPSEYDPDELWGYARCYAGQVLVLDACIGALLDALLISAQSDSTLLMLTSPRGFPMGEHLRVGAAPPALYGELLHVPWMIRQPDHEGASRRRQSLVQSSDMFATLLAWFDQTCELPMEQSAVLLARAADDADAADAIRPHSAARCGEQIAIRTAKWFFRRESADEVELFVKPDDRCEANEVAVRCAEVVSELDQLATNLLTHPVRRTT